MCCMLAAWSEAISSAEYTEYHASGGQAAPEADEPRKGEVRRGNGKSRGTVELARITQIGELAASVY